MALTKATDILPGDVLATDYENWVIRDVERTSNIGEVRLKLAAKITDPAVWYTVKDDAELDIYRPENPLPH